MPTGTISKYASIAGLSIQSSVVRNAPGQCAEEVTLAAAKAGTLSGRTDNDTGVVTLSTGHGILTGDKVTVFWAGGVRAGMSATVSGNDVTVDAGAGDNLPNVATAVTLSKQTQVDIHFHGDNLAMVVAKSDKRGHVDFQTAADASVKATELPAGEDWAWASGQGIANPFAGQVVDKAMIANGDSAASAAVQIGVLHNNVT